MFYGLEGVPHFQYPYLIDPVIHSYPDRSYVKSTSDNRAKWAPNSCKEGYNCIYRGYNPPAAHL